MSGKSVSEPAIRREEDRYSVIRRKRHAFFSFRMSLSRSALVVFSKTIPHALSTVSVAAAMSRNIQIGCSRMRSPSQMT